MRVLGSSTKDTAVLAAKNQISKKLHKIYDAVQYVSASDINDTKAILTETYNRLAVENAQPSELKAETLYRLFGEAATGNKKAQEAIRSAFLADIASEYKNDPIKAENMITLFNTLYDNLFEVTRLETANITGQFIPYTMYAAPLLRFMIPKLVATDLFTVSPMKGPLARLYFMKYYQEGTNTPYPFSAFLSKNNNTNLLEPGDAFSLYGTSPGGTVRIELNGSTSATVDLIGALKADNLIPTEVTNAPIQRGSFNIPSIVVRDGANERVVPVSGTLSADQGVFYYSSTDGFTVSGRVNFSNGQLQITVNDTDVIAVNVSARISFEVRNPARKVKLEAAEYDIKEHRIEETLLMSPEFLHDVKMLFDVDLQSEMVSILSSLIALNTDAYLLMNLYNTAKAMNAGAGLEETVSSTVPGGAVFPTPKMWYEGTFIPAIFRLEGKLRKETPSYDVEPVLVMNTVDAQYVRSVDKYTADVSEPSSVFLARRVNGTLDNVIKIVTTPILPQGVNLMVLKSANPLFATAVYAPYVTQLIPYPANTIGPAMTAVHRFGVVIPWTKAIGILNVT